MSSRAVTIVTGWLLGARLIKNMTCKNLEGSSKLTVDRDYFNLMMLHCEQQQEESWLAVSSR